MMKRAHFFWGSVLLAASPAWADVQNPSFEDVTNFISNSQDTMELLAGSTAMPGWTVTGSYEIAWIGPTNPFGLKAQAGSYFLDLTGYDTTPTGNGVTQTLTTVAGENYTLSFWLGSDFNYGIPAAITAQAGTKSQTFTSSAVGPNAWTEFSLPFIATSTSTEITLTGQTGQHYIGLDDVHVEFVPEPLSLGLLAADLGSLALGCLILAVRRRRA